MHIREATASYERWMGHHTRIVRSDLRYKHWQMTQSTFRFLCATFYRWAQVWGAAIPAVAAAPRVLAVGDLHIANFGTWRDLEGRLIWGINDFDEAFRLPYTIDLVRLVASAHLAVREDHLSLKPRAASAAVFEGYRDALRAGGLPLVLEERHHWLTKIAVHRLRNPLSFWSHLDSLNDFRGSVPQRVERAAQEMLPKGTVIDHRKRRIAGLGSLGHQRILFLADWRGARIVREAKAMIPSACVWAQGLAEGGAQGTLQHTAGRGAAGRGTSTSATESRASESRATKSHATNSHATKSHATKSGATESGATKSGATESGATRRGATASGATETGTAKVGHAVSPGHTRAATIQYGAILRHAVRVLDPFVRPVDTWLIRRLAPDCSRIEIDSLPGKRGEDRLLYSMGWETANIHLGSQYDVAQVKRDLSKRPANWLHHAAKQMVQSVEQDWRDWRSTKSAR